MIPRKGLGSSICVSEKRVSQWEELMRKFSRAHEEECKQTILDMPRAHRSMKHFPTRSTYIGTWDVLGMSGYGQYTFPNGVIYEGNFEDGMFHGKGKLRYPDGTELRGKFDKGSMVERKLIFPDGLVYAEDNWKYCKMPDRRYTQEYRTGLQPAGKSNITAEMPARKIPPGYYDTGDGFYNPESKCVYRADDLTVMIRSPAAPEQEWIVRNCRYAPDVVLGPRNDLYEKWSVPQTKLPDVPPPAAETRDTLYAKKMAAKEQEFRKQRNSDWDIQMAHKGSMCRVFETYSGKFSYASNNPSSINLFRKAITQEDCYREKSTKTSKKVNVRKYDVSSIIDDVIYSDSTSSASASQRSDTASLMRRGTCDLGLTSSVVMFNKSNHLIQHLRNHQ